MDSLDDDAGRYRLGQEGVFDGDRVPSLMNDLFEYLSNYEENILIKSAVFHYEFEFIHPFIDGNGRMGRLWQTCILASEEKIFAYLPIESIIKEWQQKYYDSIALSTKEGSSNVFIEFILDSILESFNRIMEDDYPYTLRELLNILGWESRISFKKNYLDSAINAGLIKMTLPKTPSSRNQSYIRK